MGRKYLSLIAADPARRVVGNDNVQVRFYNERTDVLATAFLDLTTAEAIALPMRANPGVEHFIRIQPLTTDTIIEVDSTTGWARGDVLRFRSGTTQVERAIKTVTDADTIVLDAAVGFAFPVGAAIRGQVGHARIAVDADKDYSADVQNVAEGWKSTRIDFAIQRGSVIAGDVGGTFAASSTVWMPVTGTTNRPAAEGLGQIPWSRAGTLTSFRLRMHTAQPAGGSLVFTVRVNGADTGLVITVAASGAAGTYSITSAVALVRDDLVVVRVVNNAAATSGDVSGWALEFED